MDYNELIMSCHFITLRKEERLTATKVIRRDGVDA